MSATIIGVGSVVKTCRCGQMFKISPAVEASGRGKYCSRACYLDELSVNRPKQLDNPHKFGRQVKHPTSITPKRDDAPLLDGGSHVACARCSRLRERGVRCSCERPMRED